MTLLLVYVTVALGFSFLCSVLEAVLLSSTPSYIATLEEEGRRSGRILRGLKKNVDRPLAAILSLNTIAHTVGAAGVGAEAQRLWGSEVLAVSSAILTMLILFLSEIIPKTVGALYWRALAPMTARILPPLIVLLYPLVWVSELLAALISRGKVEKGAIWPEEITAMARLGEEAGAVDEAETRIVRNLFRLGSLHITDIMTPRTVVLALNEDLTIGEVLERHPAMRFSRIPTWSERLDNVVGYVLKDDLLLYASRGEISTLVGELQRPILMVPETLSVARLFDQLVAEGEHIALAIDEFGGFAGVVTMEDVIETLLGFEIVDEADAVPDMQALARARWRERAGKLGLTVDELGAPGDTSAGSTEDPPGPSARSDDLSDHQGH